MFLVRQHDSLVICLINFDERIEVSLLVLKYSSVESHGVMYHYHVAFYFIQFNMGYQL